MPRRPKYARASAENGAKAENKGKTTAVVNAAPSWHEPKDRKKLPKGFIRSDVKPKKRVRWSVPGTCDTVQVAEHTGEALRRTVLTWDEARELHFHDEERQSELKHAALASEASHKRALFLHAHLAADGGGRGVNA